MRLSSFLLLTLLGTSSALAQPVVNEVLASNATTLADPDFGEFGDWIELHNPDALPVDLGGYFLTDDLDEPTRWRVPDGTVVAPGGFLVVWADDQDAAPPATTALHTDFKLSSGGEQVGLFDPSGVAVDTLSYGDQTTDVSYGRVPGGSGAWAFFAAPTPGAANTTEPSGGVLAAPAVSLESGFVGAGASVAVTAGPGATVRYTLDGSAPTDTSAVYDGPLTLSETTVLRAAAFAPGRTPSGVVTRTYFVGEEGNTLPVVSLVTDPAGFFSDEEGLYVRGTGGTLRTCSDEPANWYEDWEREAQFTFFEPDGAGGFERVLDQGAGVKIFGGCTRKYPQKSLSLHARGRYGASDFGYRFFPDVDVESFDDLVLRNSGQDWWRTMFRDGMIQVLTQPMDLDGRAYRPTVLFLNGAYWGIHNLREKLNEDYVAGHYGIDDDDVEMLDERTLRVGGQSDHYDALLALLDEGDPNDPATFADVASRIDVDQYLDYLVAEIYSANGDWPGNNVKLWRPLTPEGRWRWMFFDLDFGFGGHPTGRASSNTIALATEPDGPRWPNPPWATYLFRTLLENDGFRHAFVQRLAAHMNTTFAPERVVGVIDSLQAGIAPEMARHTARWPESTSFGQSWDRLVDLLRRFAADRPGYVRAHVAGHFEEVTGSAALDVSVSGEGRVLAEGVALPRGPAGAPFESVFFRGVPLHLTAVPADGYVFTGWSGAVTADSADVSTVLTGAASVTAAFALANDVDADDAATVLGAPYPNPASGAATVEVTLARPGPLAVRLVDMLGRRVATLADGPAAAGTHRLAVDVRALPSGVYAVVMEAGAARAARRMVVVR